MTKSSLIKKISIQRNLSVAEATTVVDTIFEQIASSLSQGQRVELRGFGSFGLKQRQSRLGRNPKTGKAVSVEAKRVMFFKAGKELRQRVDSK
jgi:integration host factor subunit beta